MSAHRQDYLAANAPRPPQTDPLESRGAQAVAITLLVIASAGAAIAHLVTTNATETPVAAPVRSPVVQVYELPPIAMEDARLEGFRAGYQSAIEQGCRPSLSQPIAPR